MRAVLYLVCVSHKGNEGFGVYPVVLAATWKNAIQSIEEIYPRRGAFQPDQGYPTETDDQLVWTAAQERGVTVGQIHIIKMELEIENLEDIAYRKVVQVRAGRKAEETNG